MSIVGRIGCLTLVGLAILPVVYCMSNTRKTPPEARAPVPAAEAPDRTARIRAVMPTAVGKLELVRVEGSRFRFPDPADDFAVGRYRWADTARLAQRFGDDASVEVKCRAALLSSPARADEPGCDSKRSGERAVKIGPHRGCLYPEDAGDGAMVSWPHCYLRVERGVSAEMAIEAARAVAAWTDASRPGYASK